MSLIGRRLLVIPVEVTVKISEDFRQVELTGPLGKVSKKFSGKIIIEQKDQQLTTKLRPNAAKTDKALWGTTNSIIQNLIDGVMKGFAKKLLISGLGYKVIHKNDTLELFLGFSHSIIFPIPADITINVPSPTVIEISGIDKERVGLIASQIRKFKKTEPYKGKGVRYHDEVPLRKAGKTTTSK